MHSAARVELLTAVPSIAISSKEESHEIGATKALTHAEENWSAPGPIVPLGKKRFCAAILLVSNDNKPNARTRIVAKDIFSMNAGKKDEQNNHHRERLKSSRTRGGNAKVLRELALRLDVHVLLVRAQLCLLSRVFQKCV